MIASHFFERSAGMIPSNPVLSKRALTPIRLAMSLPMSMSEPTGFEPWYDSSGGYVMSLQKTSWPALLMLAGGWIEAPLVVVVDDLDLLPPPPPQPAAARAAAETRTMAARVGFRVRIGNSFRGFGLSRRNRSQSARYARRSGW